MASVEGGEKPLWRESGFLKLWTAQTVSLVGTQVSRVALPLTAVLALRATPTQMGLLGMAATLPWPLLALGAGVWVDRGRRRPIIVWTNLLRAALLFLSCRRPRWAGSFASSSSTWWRSSSAR